MKITHAQLAGRLLRDAAVFFRHLAEENPALADAMQDNAQIYEQAAGLIEQDANGIIDLEEMPLGHTSDS